MSTCPTFTNVVKPNQLSLQTAPPQTNNDKPINFIDGKRAFFPEKDFEKAVKNDDVDIDDFSDWKLIRFEDNRNRTIAFFSFEGNREGSKRASKRINTMNATIAKFASKEKYPNITLLFPPTTPDQQIG